ncbi:WAP four-disulfide core domain protein 2-like [Ischnura elegans]|uniref:WAP four-disulfide core domain protein 2-like n=1 Tax=Ischnura elegans TaxID=197161 RepID=UPI001ED8AA05|nr:WAP four-disulfide core domain protein 2-like [Ischnura elegans]
MGCNAVLLLTVAVVLLSEVVIGQQPSEKPGSCPPSPGIGICAFTCSSDFQCLGSQKCCSTGCGGTSCMAPVSRLIGAPSVKKGSCPAEPKGPWICSHMCSADADCRGRFKCCKNRCGALTCQKPE